MSQNDSAVQQWLTAGATVATIKDASAPARDEQVPSAADAVRGERHASVPASVAESARDRRGRPGPSRGDVWRYRLRLAFYKVSANRAAQIILNLPAPKGPPPTLPGRQQPEPAAMGQPLMVAPETIADSSAGRAADDVDDGWSRRQGVRPAGNRPLWQGGEPIQRRHKVAPLFLMWAIGILALAAAVTGVRTWVTEGSGTPSTTQPSLPASVSFPDAAAGGVAQRFASVYLAWDVDHPDARASAMKKVGWGGDPTVGWDGHGRQSVTGVEVTAVHADTARAGTVTLAATVTPWTKKGDQWAEGTARTIGLRIPIAIADAGGSVVVSGTPAVVAVPRTYTPTDPALDDVDNDLSQETRAAITDFFRAYGTDDDVSALTAPGARIAGLNGALKLSSVNNWQVGQAADGRAAAIAQIIWSTPDGANLTQTYRLTLQKVAAGNASRWQVATIQ